MPKVKRKKKPKKERINPENFKNETGSIETMPKFELQNVVATFNLGVDSLDLRAIALEKPFIEYNPLYRRIKYCDGV